MPETKERVPEKERGRRARGDSGAAAAGVGAGRAEHLTTLLGISRRLVGTLELDEILQATTDGVTTLAGLDTAAVYLVHENRLRLWATTPPLPPDFPEELRDAPAANHPNLVSALESKAPVMLEDMPAGELTADERAVCETRNLRTVLFIPLVAGDRAVGTLIVGSVGEPRPISDTTVDSCLTLGNLAALSVENARLFQAGQAYAGRLEQNLADRERAEQERLDLERRLLHAQRLESLGVMAGGIAHDFNNLLTAMIANLDLALMGMPADSPARADIERAIDAASRATDLTTQMLAYSGKGQARFGPLDLSELVRANAALFQSSVGRYVTLELHLAESLPAIEADAGQLQQVVMNLITNASEAIGETAGTVALTTRVEVCGAGQLVGSLAGGLSAPGQFVVLQVSDTGAGMDEETRARMFDPFFTTKTSGRGLGMSSTMGIVRTHGGAIFVDSRVGEGTTVQILFPAGARAAKSGTAASDLTKLARMSGTVLVVDDDPHVLTASERMLEAMGMRVLTATNGLDAVATFRRHAAEITCVLMDLTMPKMDGVTAYRELLGINPQVKVILASGFSGNHTIPRLREPGLAGFLQKPYSMRELREVLLKVVGS